MMNRRFFKPAYPWTWISIVASIAVSVGASAVVSAETSALPSRPKLVVLLVIDQFRADYLSRFESRFLPSLGKNGELGGFRYLIQNGAYFPWAEYQILQSMTCPGHATVLTGALPYQMGIPLNRWFNSTTGQTVYCVEDAKEQIVGGPTTPHTGTSPRNLIGTTVGDELKNAGYPSKVVTVALKDRAAIMMGGHRADLALWMDQKAHQWVSSTFYLNNGQLPEWVTTLNQDLRKSEQGKTFEWTLNSKGTGYSTEAHHPKDDTAHIGRQFPHILPLNTKESLASPYGIDVTEQAAERAQIAYHLGEGARTDLLAVSFSSHDYVGHGFGPNSREMEEMTVMEDRAISKLLNHLKRSIPGGLDHIVIALTGDHGIPMEPDLAKVNRLDAGRIVDAELSAKINQRLNEKLGKPIGAQDWVSFNEDLNVFIHREALKASQRSLSEVADVVKAEMLQFPGIAHAFTAKDVEQRTLPPGLHQHQILNTYFAGRSGDVIGIPRPFFLSHGGDTVGHMTGYSYDRTVPLVITGPRIKKGHYSQIVRVNDLAPTLSSLTGVLAPALNEGRVLHEVIKE